MIKVLFVCLGNICRSPMAEYIFKDMVKKEEISENFYIDSAATSAEEIGNPVHYGTRNKLNQMNIECGNHLARRITKQDYEKFDYIIGMEEKNIINIKRIVGEDYKNKVFKLLDFSNNPRDIADPWYTGNFDKTYDDILEGLMGFLVYLKNKKMKLILASGSKQRQDIFKMIGWKYEVVRSLVEEKSTATNPEEYVKELSMGKASSVSAQIKEKAIIVSADTVIYMNGKIYEKPKSKEEAFQNLKDMSGKITYAVTGVTIKDLYQDKTICFSDTAEVYLKKISDEDIKWYVENDDNILNRCGYSMLGKASIFLDKVNGDYNTLFGISPSKLYEKFQELGYKISDFEIE